MVQCSTARLDASFAARSDETRRGVLERLGRSDASITELAEAFDMTLTGEDEAAWIEAQRRLWAARFEALNAVIEDLKRKEKADG